MAKETIVTYTANSTSTSMPYSSYVDIAPNEYVTKYSLNRNFEKLLSNDYYLYSKTGDYLILTYNKLKTYDAGELVFYKIQKSDTKFYILSSAQGPNTHKPTVRKNSLTDDLFVVNSDWWVIVGIDPAKGNSLPKDQADMHVNDCRLTFIDGHQDNPEPNAHPTGVLGLQKSSKLFKTLENIEEDRSKFFYPGYILSFVADSTTYSGYMRKWDNGLLEYDLTFRLGYISSDAAGLDIISANSLDVPHRNNNFMYFKEECDYKIFNHGGENYVVTPTSKQVNLNPLMNAYSGQIKFIEPFKDLNYMVFASNTKSIDTEAFNLKNDAIRDYDRRLVLDGLAIAGYLENAVFNTPCKIPNEVINIKKDALGGIELIENTPVVFYFDPWQSSLVNIDSYAFSGTGLESIDIPASVRYIAPYAFSNCSKLTCINFYLHSDTARLVRIDKGAFPFGVKEVNFFYENDLTPLFGAQLPSHDYLFTSSILLEVKMRDANYRAYIGLNAASGSIALNSSRQDSLMLFGASRAHSTIEDAVAVDSIELTLDLPQDNVFTIDLNDLISEMSAPLSLRKSSKMRFAAIKPIVNANDVFLLNESVITGFNSTGIDGLVSFDLADLTTVPTSMSNGALRDFTLLTGLTVNEQLSSILPDSLPPSLQYLALRVGNAVDGHYDMLSTVVVDQQLEDPDLPATLTTVTIGTDVENLSVVYVGSNAFALTANASNLSIDGYNGKTILPNTLHGQVDSLFAYNAKTIDTSAFFGCSINNCTILSYNGTSLSSDMFGYDSYTDELGTTTRSSWLKLSLSLVGNSWTIDSQALAYMYFNVLSIDMYNTEVMANALLSTNIDFLYLANVDHAKQSTIGSIDYYGFLALSLKDFSTRQLYAVGLPLDSISSTYLDANAMALLLAEDMIVRGDDGAAWWSIDSRAYESYDTSLFIIDGTTLRGFKPDIEIPDEIDIPYGMTDIAANAFYRADANELSNVMYIYIPSSVKSIGENAFRNLSSMRGVNIEPGTSLTSLGANAFDLSISLASLAFYS